MPEHRDRFLAFVDLLGTSHLYADAGAGLAFAYEQENVRRGSRLFLSKHITPAHIGAEISRFVFEWTSMTGAGRPTGTSSEFLWPAYIYKADPFKLLEVINAAFTVWRQHPHAASGAISPDFYRETLYHFDETIKICVRSVVAFRGEEIIRHLAPGIASLLPHESDPMDDTEIRYLWGIWFQVIYVLLVCGVADDFQGLINHTLSELKRRKYFDSFVAEADYDDYRIMRTLVTPAYRSTRS